MLIQNDETTFMRALERVLQTPDWVTAILFLSLLLLVVLKAYNPQKLSGVLSSLYNKGFLEIEAQEKQSPFTFFTIVFTLFSLFSIALGVYVSICYVTKQQFLFTDYTQILLFLLIYMFGRFTLEYLLTQLFGIKNELSFFFQSKRSYLFSISAGIWVFVLIYFYSKHACLFS